MTILFQDGLESNGFVPWTNTWITGGGALGVVDGPRMHGLYAAHATGTIANDNAAAYKTFGSAYQLFCLRAYVRWKASSQVCLFYCNNGGTGIANIRLDAVGTANTVLYVGNYAVGYSASAAFASSFDRWYCIELQFYIANSPNGWFKGIWDGDPKVNVTGVNTNSGANINQAYVGAYQAWGVPEELYFDDVVMSDTPIGMETMPLMNLLKSRGYGNLRRRVAFNYNLKRPPIRSP